MAQQTINLGTNANDKTGDTLRAGGAKINANFTELYGKIDAINRINGAAVTKVNPAQADIDSDVGLTAAAAGDGYAAQINFTNGSIIVVSNGTTWDIYGSLGLMPFGTSTQLIAPSDVEGALGVVTANLPSGFTGIIYNNADSFTYIVVNFSGIWVVFKSTAEL